MAERKLEQEFDSMSERLARIEQSQIHLANQLDKVVTLLDRMVRVEEHIEEHKESMQRLFKRLERAETRIAEQEKELARWHTGKKIFIWVIGTAISIGGLVLALSASGALGK